MKGINKVILVGTLGRDPEMKYAPNGNAIANLSIATSEQWNDKSTGQKQEKTEWHRVVIFGKLAEVAGQYLTKGSQVYVEGKLQTRKWQDQNTGQDRYSTEVVLSGFDSVMQMLGGNNQGGAQQQSMGQYNPGMQQNPVMQQQPVMKQQQQAVQQPAVQQQLDVQQPVQDSQFKNNHDQFSDDDVPF